ncbi:MAG: glycerol-3-phosphate 1-O-acyltransferase PlsY [Alphaproteobacteria bacterium]|jgi:glycerol-3-phosphate acyltransferase PlsY|nr:glycerol-3-phosphate 1-O-acyltransferase PlsY [Alphaproteobacteria bacterium]MCB1551665.1 glycerol-3-phosphate 1-O-acyltransferase PlsY [Alphaproteobacteria bacterium]MCB9984239.1 glycerol-3-phosphate 1-O-acyltransferase PlsY [Micavibrio sp.]HPQ51007.1 glycerol-3-phosphate 1-O-acyltransferase PlsY [Alphaproteobacteria bacterium]HRK97083.1 glycerol-3-phosphate 1-O-acyltransferase PlsY [Alphaproteobacteria bacterium]
MIEAIISHIQLNGLIGFSCGYLLGSIPFGLVLCAAFGYGDIRKIGSGNIGATNVLRTGNKLLAVSTVILDSSKGLIAVLVAAALLDSHAMFGAALGAIIGHNFPVWLKFKGGKGVATTLGTFLALSWPVGLACCAAWLVTALVSRISSLSALVALAVAPIFVVVIGDTKQLYLIGIISMLGWLRHRTNIERLIKGTEPKIGNKKDATA